VGGEVLPPLTLPTESPAVSAPPPSPKSVLTVTAPVDELPPPSTVLTRVPYRTVVHQTSIAVLSEVPQPKVAPRPRAMTRATSPIRVQSQPQPSEVMIVQQ
jgi:hypothetical protein